MVDVNFVCPICESTEYVTIYTSSAHSIVGHKIPVSGYYCKGCSVRFNNPEKFGVVKIKNCPNIFGPPSLD